MSALAPALTYALPARRHPVVQFILHQPLGAGGLVFIVIMALAAIFAPWVTPYDPLTVDYGSMLAAPSWQHWMGTDSFGRDMLTRVIYGARTALAVGFLASFVGSTAGAIVTETVFAWPGVGRLTYEAVIYRDFPLLQAVIILKAILILTINLVVDILYAVFDPRIRYR